MGAGITDSCIVDCLGGWYGSGKAYKGRGNEDRTHFEIDCADETELGDAGTVLGRNVGCRRLR